MLDWLKKHKIPVLLLLILTLLTYGNSLNNAFLSDDLAEIVNNPNIGSFVSITTHPFGFIRHLLYFLAFHIGGLNQVLFRSINIFFHTGSVLLIYVLFQFFFARKTSLILAAIFAVHPAISEAVVWISGGMYPQYSFFFLLSFILYILSQTQKNNKYYRASIIAFLFSFMSHPQMPLSLFLIFPLWEFSFGNLKNNWKKTIPFFTLTIVYLLVALTSLPERETTLKSMHYQSGGIDNPFVLIPVAITSYLELILLPKALTLYHSELSFDTINFIIRAAVTLLLLIITLFSFKKNKFIFFGYHFFSLPSLLL